MWKTILACAAVAALAVPADPSLARSGTPISGVPGASALAGPDYWVGLGREKDLQFSRTEYVRQDAIDAGNVGSPGQQQQLVTLVVSQDGRDVCSTSNAIAPPGPRRTVPAVALQVVYSSPIDTSPGARKVRFRIVATIAPAADDQRNEDQNPSNNRMEADLQFPAGGKPRCVALEP